MQQPAYGTGCVIGEAFTLQVFIDELNAAGMIPLSLMRWELAGEAGAK